MVHETMVMGSAAFVERKKQLVLPAAAAALGQLAVRVKVDPRDVVFVKGLLEASEGLASLFCDRGGALVLAAPLERKRELVQFLRDLQRELGARVEGDLDCEALAMDADAEIGPL